MKRAVRYLGLVANKLSNWGGIAAAVSVFTLMSLMFIGTVARYLFNRPNIFVDEVSAYLLVLATFFGLAYTAKVGGHVIVEVLTTRLRPQLNRKIQVANELLQSLFIAILLWAAVTTVWNSYKVGSTSYSPLAIPLFIPQMVIPIGLAICLFYSIARIGR